MITYRADVTVQLKLVVESVSAASARETARRQALRLGGHSATVSDVQVTPFSAVEQMHVDNLSWWQEAEAVKTKGLEDQRARWNAGRLPEYELLELARPELFSSFRMLIRRQKMVFATIDHPKDAQGILTCLKGPVDWERLTQRASDLVTWSTSPHPALSVTEQRTLHYIETTASELATHAWLARSTDAITVQSREHRGVCKMCQRTATERSALVQVRWAGRTLSREYLL